MSHFRPTASRKTWPLGRRLVASPPELGPAVPRGRAERVKSLDGIRAISILAVFGYHALVLHMRGGWLGVETFFVLSGYLITSVLLAEYLRTGDLSLSRFWRRRVRRLWPALMVMVIVVAPAYRAGPFAWHSFGAYAVSAMQAVLYVSDLGLAYFGGSAGFIGHTWTLGVEMYFYVLWPLLLLWLLRSRRQLLVPTLLGLCVTSIVATTTNLATDPGAQLGYYAPYTQALPLLVGSLLAVLQHDGTLPKLSPKSGSLLAAVGMSGLISLILLSKMVEGTNFFTPLLLATASTGILLFGLEAAPSFSGGETALGEAACDARLDLVQLLPVPEPDHFRDRVWDPWGPAGAVSIGANDRLLDAELPLCRASIPKLRCWRQPSPGQTTDLPAALSVASGR